MTMTNNLKTKLLDLGLSEEEASDIVARMEQLKIIPVNCQEKPEKLWLQMVQQILTKKGAQHYPFSLHLLLYQTIYPDWDKIPAPAWFPEQNVGLKTKLHLSKWMKEKGFEHYSQLHHWSSSNRAKFWNKITKTLRIKFDQPYSGVMDLTAGIENVKWFPGGKLNIANSCFQANDDEIAVIEADELGNNQQYTYRELNELSDKIAHSVKKDLLRGDRVAIIMPLHFQAIALYLGVIKAGGQVVSIAESFSANEIETRLKIADCHYVFTQRDMMRDGKKIPLLEKIIAAKASRIIVFSADDFANAEVAPAAVHQSSHDISVSCDPMDSINILFSSGTSGDPKAIPWNHTTPIKCASDAYFHHNIKTGDRLCWHSSLGWMMGPWSIFAALINRATIAVYTGSPNGRRFGEFIQNHQITILGVVPTLVRHWRETSCMEKLNWDAIKVFTSTGECSNPQDMLYLMYLAGYRPIIEYCGGTEIGGAYITGSLLQPCAPAAFTTAAMGLDFVVLDEEGKPSHQEEMKGEMAIVPPSIGLSTQLLNSDHQQIYYEGMPNLADGHILRRHGDQTERYKNGYYYLLGRRDDTMNLSGIKISSAEIERVLNLHPSVLETAAVSISHQGRGPEELIVFLVLKQDINSTTRDKLNENALLIELQQLIKEKLNPLFKIQHLKIIEKLPRTASNKVMRRLLR